MVPRHPELLPQSLGHHLARGHADGTGEGRGLSHDAVCRRRYEITAGTGDVAHGDNHRLTPAARTRHLATDHVRRHIRAARAVDTEDDGPDVVVVRGPAEGARHTVRAHGMRAGEGRMAAASAVDLAQTVDQRHRRGVVFGVLGTAAILRQRQELDVISQRFAHQCIHLVAVPQAVH